jgi:hypothetical protein
MWQPLRLGAPSILCPGTCPARKCAPRPSLPCLPALPAGPPPPPVCAEVWSTGIPARPARVVHHWQPASAHLVLASAHAGAEQHVGRATRADVLNSLAAQRFDALASTVAVLRRAGLLLQCVRELKRGRQQRRKPWPPRNAWQRIEWTCRRERGGGLGAPTDSGALTPQL